MAVTVTDIARTVFGNKRAVVAEITFDSSYPTGGEPLTAAQLGLASVDAVFPAAAVNSTPLALGVRYDKANAKLLAFYGDNDAGADSGLIQVPDTTNLSAYSATVLVIGN